VGCPNLLYTISELSVCTILSIVCWFFTRSAYKWTHNWRGWVFVFLLSFLISKHLMKFFT